MKKNVLILLILSLTPLYSQWTSYNSGIDSKSAYCFVQLNNNLLIGNRDGLFVSSNLGEDWVKRKVYKYNISIISLFVNKNKIFASNQYNLFYSDNVGESWKIDSTFFNQFTIINGNQDRIFAGNNKGLFYSDNNGENWVEIGKFKNSGINNLETIDSIVIISSKIGTYISYDYGLNWDQFDAPVDKDVIKIYIKNNNYFFIVKDKGIFYSSDYGKNWKLKNYGIADVQFYKSIILNENKLLIGTEKGMYFSTNMGDSWEIDYGIKNDIAHSFYKYDNFLFAGAENSIYMTSDNGKNWITKNNGLEEVWINSIICNNDYIYLATNNEGFYTNKISEKKWIKSEEVFSFNYSIAKTKNKVFIGSGGSLYVKDDTASSYQKVKYGYLNQTVLSASGENQNIAAFIAYGNFETKTALYSSTDEGENWLRIDDSTNSYIMKIQYSNDTLFSSYADKITFTTDNGKTWINTNFKLKKYDDIIRTFEYKNGLFLVGTSKYGIYKSTDVGNTWKLVFDSTSKSEVISISIKDNFVFAGTLRSGFYFSRDYGETWEQKNDGCQDTTIKTIAYNDQYVYIGTRNNGIYRRPLSDFENTVVNESNNISKTIISPNPASDYIDISLSPAGGVRGWKDTPFFKGGQGVSLEIFNLFGEKVEQTFLSVQCGQTGMSDLLKIDISNLPVGVYFIKIGDKFEKFVKM